MLPRFQIEGKTDVWISQVRRVKQPNALILHVMIASQNMIDKYFFSKDIIMFYLSGYNAALGVEHWYPVLC